ncbi:TPA: hypothetical protein TXL63_001653 [Streptococcus suis]|nr:hypothetical protein [Streptococcus suis]
MSYELGTELFKGEILDKYVMNFLSNTENQESIEMLNFSNSLIKEVEAILASIDSQDYISVRVLYDLQNLLDKFVNDNRSSDYQLRGRYSSNKEKLLNTLSKMVLDEKQWITHNQESKKLASNIRRCILKVLNAVTEFQNEQLLDMDNLIEIIKREFPIDNGKSKNQVFLSHAYVDRAYTLGLFLFFYSKGIYLYIDWMHQGKGLSSKKIKNNLIPAINNSSQLLFLRTLNSELGLQGGNRLIREWCAWEIGTFDFKSRGQSSEGFYINRYRQNNQVKSRSSLIQDYQPLKSIQNGRLY